MMTSQPQGKAGGQVVPNQGHKVISSRHKLPKDIQNTLRRVKSAEWWWSRHGEMKRMIWTRERKTRKSLPRLSALSYALSPYSPLPHFPVSLFSPWQRGGYGLCDADSAFMREFDAYSAFSLQRAAQSAAHLPIPRRRVHLQSRNLVQGSQYLWLAPLYSGARLWGNKDNYRRSLLQEE